MTDDFTEVATIDTLARIIYAEARGEDLVSKQAVAWVIKNRLGSYQGDWLKVMTDKNQFDVHKGIPKEKEAWNKCFEAALQVYQNEVEDPTGGALNFHSFEKGPSHIPSGWGDKDAYRFIKTIGEHHFYDQV